MADGALFGVAHPTIFPTAAFASFCRGCEFTLGDQIDWDEVTTLEVVTSLDPRRRHRARRSRARRADPEPVHAHRDGAVAAPPPGGPQDHRRVRQRRQARPGLRAHPSPPCTPRSSRSRAWPRPCGPATPTCAPAGRSRARRWRCRVHGRRPAGDRRRHPRTPTPRRWRSTSAAPTASCCSSPRTGCPPASSRSSATTSAPRSPRPVTRRSGPLGTFWRVDTADLQSLTTIGNPVFLARRGAAPPRRPATAPRSPASRGRRIPVTGAPAGRRWPRCWPCARVPRGRRAPEAADQYGAPHGR